MRHDDHDHEHADEYERGDCPGAPGDGDDPGGPARCNARPAVAGTVAAAATVVAGTVMHGR
ncbi:hypothetical protein [Streptomyces sp. NRRL S-118]|uniref:hypothetical protein n=1 Tax=Streptomyces sp. NRRL S-118 TaxID=1463881 RepID=UPI0005873912|nr:hypothetical protein [Streptomyces sp. NRRL S-118]